MLKTLLILASCLLLSPAYAGGDYLQPADFIQQTFGKPVPKARALWLNKSQQQTIKQILAHDFKKLRIRYWQQGEKSAWILNEIGKEKPITIGVVINRGKIQSIHVLSFRESRGSEIRHDFFTRQFKQLTLTQEQKLDKPIDGISGATLSVRAMTKIARIALYLDQQIRKAK